MFIARMFLFSICLPSLQQPFLEEEDCKVIILAHVITAPSHVVETVHPLLPEPCLSLILRMHYVTHQSSQVRRSALFHSACA